MGLAGDYEVPDSLIINSFSEALLCATSNASATNPLSFF